MNVAILHRYPVSEIKGTNPSFLYFLKELKAAGHQPYVVTLKEKSSREYPVEFNYFPLSLTFKRANDPDKWVKSLLFALLAPFKVRNLKARFNLEMVYCDDSLPFYAYLVKVISGLPCVMRLGDLQTAYLFESAGGLGKVLYQFLHSIEKFTWRKIDKIIAISESFRRFLIKEGIASKKIAVVEESIDTAEFQDRGTESDLRKKYHLGASPLVMFHGLVAEIKGLDILLNAVPNLIEKIPQLKVMIVGDGPALGALKQLSRRLGISDSVIFTGWVPFAEIPGYISFCDIGIPLRSANLGNNFVLTTAFLQYALLKRPVVVPALQAFEDTIGDNPQQVVFALNNPRELAARIIELLQDKEKAGLSAANNYKMAQEKFAAEKIGQRLTEEVVK